MRSALFGVSLFFYSPFSHFSNTHKKMTETHKSASNFFFFGSGQPISSLNGSLACCNSNMLLLHVKQIHFQPHTHTYTSPSSLMPPYLLLLLGNFPYEKREKISRSCWWHWLRICRIFCSHPQNKRVDQELIGKAGVRPSSGLLRSLYSIAPNRSFRNIRSLER